MAKFQTFTIKYGEKNIFVGTEILNNLHKEITAMRKELSKSIKDAIKDEKKLKSELDAARSAANSVSVTLHTNRVM